MYTTLKYPSKNNMLVGLILSVLAISMVSGGLP